MTISATEPATLGSTPSREFRPDKGDHDGAIDAGPGFSATLQFVRRRIQRCERLDGEARAWR